MNIDLSILIWMQEFFGPGTRPIWDIITNLGSAPVLVLIVGMVVWTSGTANGLRVLFAFMFSVITVLLLKVVFLHPRPYYVYDEVQPWRDSDGLGMPSGHSGGAAGLWGTLAIALQRRWVTVGAILLILLIGLSRIYFGVHSLSQVLIGWGIGLLFVLAVWRLEKWAIGFFTSLGLWRQLGLVVISTLILVVIKTTAIAALDASYPPPRSWQERHQQAQIYEASLSGDYPAEFEPLRLFGELGVDVIGAFLGMWLVVLYTANRRSFGNYTGRQRIVNVAAGFVGLATLIGLIQIFEGNTLIEIILWSGLPVVLGIGAPLVGERFARQ